MRLDLALIRRHPGLSRRKARQAIEKGHVLLDGEPEWHAGKLVSLESELVWDPSRPAARRARISLPRLYEGGEILVVDKPAGLLAVPTPGASASQDSALARVKEYVRHLRPRFPYVGVVHRIDRGTSGALAFALSPRGREALRALFREHHLERRYLALVYGQPRQRHGKVEAAIHAGYRQGRRRLAREGEASHDATTHFRVVEQLGSAAVVELTLETGRQHQVRLHLAHLGHPVLGDRVYGPSKGQPGLPLPRPLLHARLLRFVDPLTGTRVSAESPLPADFRHVLSHLRRHKPYAR